MENPKNMSEENKPKEQEHIHEITNEEHWVHDVNEEFAEDLPHIDETKEDRGFKDPETKKEA